MPDSKLEDKFKLTLLQIEKRFVDLEIGLGELKDKLKEVSPEQIWKELRAGEEFSPQMETPSTAPLTPPGQAGGAATRVGRFTVTPVR